MSIPKTPITIAPRSIMGFIDADLRSLREEQISRDLTVYYDMLRKQAGCNHTDYLGEMYTSDHCPACGADLAAISWCKKEDC